jgi:predicted RNA binding protein YcfA (HicA-like mRNA interferase family)
VGEELTAGGPLISRQLLHIFDAAANCNRSRFAESGTTSQDVNVLTNSRDIIRRLQRESWTLERVTGSHHIFKSPRTGATVVVPHPRKDLGPGLVLKIYRDAGWSKD